MFELNVQYFMIGYPSLSSLFMTTPITLGMHFTAVGLGLGALGVGAGAKFIPIEHFELVPKIEEAETEGSFQSRFKSKFNKEI